MKIQLLSELAKVPTRGSLEAAGWDLYAATTGPVTIPSGCTIKIPTDIAIELPPNTFGAIYPRSGMASSRGLRCANCVGVVDSDYRGVVTVAMHNDSNEMQIVEPGERIAQLIIQPYIGVTMETVDSLSKTDRGTGGFGSTGTM